MTRLPFPAVRLLPAIGALILAGAVSAVDAVASPPSPTLVRRITWSELESRGELKAACSAFSARSCCGRCGRATASSSCGGSPRSTPPARS